jgi:hypothetical protein
VRVRAREAGGRHATIGEWERGGALSSQVLKSELFVATEGPSLAAPQAQPFTENETLVRGMWLAHREGRIADMLRFVHPAVIWLPISRPGRTLYQGLDGTVMMIDDIRAAVGDYVLALDDVTETRDGLVQVVGRIVASDGSDPVAIEMDVTLWLGLVKRVQTRPSTS